MSLGVHPVHLRDWASLHALDGGERKTGEPDKMALIQPE